MATNGIRSTNRDHLDDSLTRAKQFFSFLRCPSCGAKVQVENGKAGFARSGRLICVRCSATYAIKNYIPELLPSREATLWESLIRTQTVKISDKQAYAAREWMLDVLGISEADIRETRASKTLWRDIAYLRKAVRNAQLSEDVLLEFIAMWGARGMAPRYKNTIADQLLGERLATNYERYEDVLLRVILRCILDDNEAVLVELGSGVGRLLMQYASCKTSRREAARPYRSAFPDMYEPDSLGKPQHLRMLIGLDFESRMLRSSSAWLSANRLTEEIRTGVITQVLGSMHHLPFGLEHHMFDKATKVVCIMFQTIGNQLTSAHRSQILRYAWELAKPDGVLVVSAFNGEFFQKLGIPYYQSIQASVGKAIHVADATFVSEKGIYSKWMIPSELERTCHAAGIANPLLLWGSQLEIFPEFDRYIRASSQSRVKNRTLLAVASTDPALLAKVRQSLCS